MSELIALHGYTQNGTVLARQLEPLAQRLPARVRVACPDAPLTCSPASVERMYAHWKMERLPPPHLSWWDATDDGREYRGWERSRARLAALVDRPEPVGVLGFSQGAIVATALAALAEHGELPQLRFVVLVAGRAPRADVFAALLTRPISVPSLHVWGERDTLAAPAARALVEHFAADRRTVVRWPGAHAVPREGAAADAIVEFVAQYA